MMLPNRRDYLPTILLHDNWRAAVFDEEQGIKVVDVTASSEEEAKGRAHSAAANNLGCTKIKSVTVCRHTALPFSFLERITQDSK